ncbi:MAG TPA: MFS transporter [Solirubrobacterales bacterium]|jgi:EmrB/QacA subfamily drug resistance transporter|nr:MFS transporter [Solirubrobacterales bacterium]
MERKWWTLLLVSIATFMLLLDVTVVNVALPDIQRELHASLSSLQWVVDAYSLMLAAFLLTAGSLGDRLGRRRVFTIGFGIFTFASFLCGISDDPTLLNLARGLQGIGGAGMFATSLALIGQEFQGKDRATAFGVWGAVVGGAVAVGPLVGGVITESLGWEWIFFVNVPIGITAMVLTERKIVNVFAKDPEPIDVPGLVTFSLALFLLIFGLIRGNPEGWGSPLILACLIGSAVLLSAFVAIELRSKYPMLDLSLFRKGAFNGVSAVAFGLSAGMFAMFLYLTIYMQGVLDYSPLEAGLRFLPLTVLGFIVAPISGALSNRIPIRVLLGVGLATVGVGLLLMHGVSPDSGWTTLLGGFLVAGIGIGITNPGIGQAAIAVVPVEKSGMGSGINTTFRQVGIATGVAGLGAVFQSSVNSKISELLPRAPSGLGEIIASGGSRAAGAVAPARIKPEVVHASNVAFVGAFNEIILIAAILSFVGAALGFALVRSRDFVQHAGPEEPKDETASEPVPA